MTLANTARSVLKTLQNNSPIIFSSTAITGVVTTAYLASKATLRARDKIRAYENVAETKVPGKDRLIYNGKLIWKFYVTTAASGALTIFCIVQTTRVTNKRAAAAQVAFVLSERAFSEYRNKVIEEYGERKDQTIRDSIVEDRIRKNPPPSGDVLMIGSGSVLCCELHTGRYFPSDMETLRKAQNDLNARLIHQDSASLDDFYYLIGLSSTSHSGEIGWNSDKLLALDFTSALTEDGRPCLAFAYNYTRPLFEGLFR